MIADCASHLIMSVLPGRGPGPDFHNFKPALELLPKSVKIDCLLGDAGYDSEGNHQHARKHLNIRTLIQPRMGSINNRPVNGYYRRLMARLFQTSPNLYRRRWQIETVMSMLKRRLGHALSSRNYHSQTRELCLKSIALNLIILANL